MSRWAKGLGIALSCLAGCGGSTSSGGQASAISRGPTGDVDPAPNDIEFPKKYKNWPVLSVSHRLDKRHMQVVVGNLEAVRALRDGKTNPWPDGTIIGHVVWKQNQSVDNPTIISTGDIVRAEFMFKDVERWAENSSGWGWARWTGSELTPYGSDGFESECIACHKDVSDQDWVHTRPSQFP